MSKQLIIIRAVSGAGKSTFADTIKDLNPDDVIICCADDYFTDSEGNYNFDPNKLFIAHKECKLKAQMSMESGVGTVIIANTNTKLTEFKDYEKFAEDNSYRVFHIVLENRHGNKDVHNVPSNVLTRQDNAIRMNLKLS